MPIRLFIFLTLSLHGLLVAQSAQVKGTVYILSSGGTIYRLPLASVNFYSSSQVNSSANRAKAKISPVLKQYRIANDKVNAAIDAVDSIEPISYQDWQNRNSYPLDTALAAKSYATQYQYSLARERRDSLIKYRDYLYLPAYSDLDDFKESMGRPANSAKTNVDGFFSAYLKPGKYLLVASSSRYIYDETEYYDWVFWVTVSGAKNIDLNNDNLLSDSRKSLILDEALIR